MLVDTYEDEERAYLFDETYHLFASLPYLFELVCLSVNSFQTLAAYFVWVVLYAKLFDGFSGPIAM